MSHGKGVQTRKQQNLREGQHEQGGILESVVRCQTRVSRLSASMPVHAWTQSPPVRPSFLHTGPHTARCLHPPRSHPRDPRHPRPARRRVAVPYSSVAAAAAALVAALMRLQMLKRCRVGSLRVCLAG